MAIDTTGLKSLIASLTHYPNSSRVEKDARSLLSAYPSLKANVSFFDYKSQRIRMFYLYGTVPIVYNGVVYHIPVTFFFDPPYPDRAPRCFVTPTQIMQIKPNHRWVDNNGVIFHPYLSNWKYATSNLLAMVHEIIEVFNADPPVYAISPQSVPAHPQAMPPRLQEPPDYSQSMSAYAQTMPYPSQSMSNHPQSMPNYPQSMPNYPQSMPNYPQSMPNHPQSMPNHPQSMHMYHQTASSYPNLQTHPASHSHGNLNRAPNSPQSGMAEHTMQMTGATMVSQKESTMREAQLVTQQINSSWDVFMAPLVAERNAQHLIEEETELKQGQLTANIVRRRDKLDLIQKDIFSLELAESSLSAFIEEEKGKKTDLKSLVVLENELSQQLLDLTAEIAAREDLVSQYDEALRYERVDGHEYLRGLRENFRENYLALQLRSKVLKMKADTKQDSTAVIVS